MRSRIKHKRLLALLVMATIILTPVLNMSILANTDGLIVIFTEDSFVFTGEAITPAVIVSDGDEILDKGTDYNIFYENNIHAKLASASDAPAVIIDGLGDYDGIQIKKTFTIEQLSPAISGVAGSDITVGGVAQMEATLSGGINPAGTITFVLYDSADNPIHTETVSVSGNETYSTSTGFTSTSAGSYKWTAFYSGDQNHKPAVISEIPQTVTKFTPIITAAVDPATYIASSALSGAYNPIGTVTYALYNSLDGSGAPIKTETVAITGGTIPNSPSPGILAAGNYSYIASYTGDPNNVNCASAAIPFTVSSNPVTYFEISGLPSTTTAGTSFNITVTAKDASNNTVTDYTGMINFTSSDTQAALPANSTLTNGVGTFNNITFKTAGTQSITVKDTVNASVIGTANSSVSPSAVVNFIITNPATATAGTSFSMTVTAKDQYGNTATNYAGMINFTSSDAQAALPANYSTLTNGTGTFNVLLKTAGTHIVAITDTIPGAITGVSGNITVSPAPASKFEVTDAPLSTVMAGNQFNIKVTAKDAFDNTATNYTGAVQFTSSDLQAILPPNSTLINGAGIFGIILRTAGLQNITATDTISSSITGISQNIVVSASQADLEINIFVDNPNPKINDNVTFTVTVKNKGPSNATGVFVNIKLPGGDNYPWAVGNLSKDATVSLPVSMKVESPQITVLAEITESDQLDPVTANNKKSETISVLYTVKYNLNGGAQETGNYWNSYIYGSGLTLPTAPKMSGYQFAGWYDNINLIGAPVSSISNTAAGDKEFWARWIMTVSPPIILTYPDLPNGTNGTSYLQYLSAAGDFPITWGIISGNLPNGLSLNMYNGCISGTPTVSGTFYFTVMAMNSAGNDTKSMYITINSAASNYYNVDISNSYASYYNTGSGNYLPGERVTIYAGSRPDYTFSGWVTSNNISLSNVNNSTATFIMPYSNVSFTATWNYIGSSNTASPPTTTTPRPAPTTAPPTTIPPATTEPSFNITVTRTLQENDTAIKPIIETAAESSNITVTRTLSDDVTAARETVAAPTTESFIQSPTEPMIDDNTPDYWEEVEDVEDAGVPLADFTPATTAKMTNEIPKNNPGTSDNFIFTVLSFGLLIGLCGAIIFINKRRIKIK